MFKNPKAVFSLIAIVLVLLFSAVLLPIIRKSSRGGAQQNGIINHGTNQIAGNYVDLTHYVNATLAESVHSNKREKGNNLAELPMGKQTLAGVSFDVEGIVQLMGHSMIKYQKEYPPDINNIEVNQFCHHLYVLHGASSVTQRDIKVATLVLNYADGSQHEFDMISGQQVFDYWGIPGNQPLAPGTELAWTGHNPFIKKWRPQMSLRLFCTTFDNPRPDAKVASVSYKSGMSDAAPFLLGLTVN
jgi:hypothetical protein